MICNFCSTNNADDAAVCRGCGRVLGNGRKGGLYIGETDMTPQVQYNPGPRKMCPHCGSSIEFDAVFCTECGRNTTILKKGPNIGLIAGIIAAVLVIAGFAALILHNIYFDKNSGDDEPISSEGEQSEEDGFDDGDFYEDSSEGDNSVRKTPAPTAGSSYVNGTYGRHDMSYATRDRFLSNFDFDFSLNADDIDLYVTYYTGSSDYFVGKYPSNFIKSDMGDSKTNIYYAADNTAVLIMHAETNVNMTMQEYKAAYESNLDTVYGGVWGTSDDGTSFFTTGGVSDGIEYFKKVYNVGTSFVEYEFICTKVTKPTYGSMVKNPKVYIEYIDDEFIPRN